MKETTLKKQKSLDIQADVISNLPSVVLYKIVECLPLHDAARTSVLSHKWHKIWTSIPSLLFDEQFFRTRQWDKATHEFCAIVTNVLLQHDGPITKFSLYVTAQRHSPDVSQWMSYLSRKGIRDFSLFHTDTCSFEISSLLYPCGGLPNLNSLELEGVKIKCSNLDDFFGRCPALEKIVLQNCIFQGRRHLTIDVPNLKSFTIGGAFDSVDFRNGKNIVSVAIVMRETKLFSSNDCCDDLIKGLESSSKLEMLALGGRFCRVMFNGDNNFENLRNLELISLQLTNSDDFFFTINLIRSIPNIERLKISVCTTENLDDNMLDYNPEWTLNHLHSASIGIMSASSIELKLIEYFLGCSPVLEKLSVSFNLPVEQDIGIRMLMLVNQFIRVSQKVKVVFGHVGSVTSSLSYDNLGRSYILPRWRTKRSLFG